MLELLFLLLPIAAAYGWYMGHRSARKDQDTISNKFSRDYVTGINLLLSNQHEKAADLFLDILQKQEQENNIETGSQFEAELTLGNLYRSRGEVDRALRIHQALDSSPNYTFEQKLLAKQQLAKDFLTIGFYDRAENLYILLIDEPNYAENALQQLAVIYQKTKEWKKAINVAEKLAKISPTEDNIALAHYYCEYSLTLGSDEQQQAQAIHILKQALNVSKTSVRASILIAERYIVNLEYQRAVQHLENVLTQNADYMSEILPALKYCYQELNRLDNFELFLIRASQTNNNSAVDLALSDLIAEKDGIVAAQTKLHQQLEQNPSTFILHRFIQYQIDAAENGKAKESLILLHKIVGDRIARGFDYRCSHCGYQTHKLSWNCPSCRKWEKIKPIVGTEHH